MRKTLFGVVITLIVLFTFKYCGDNREDKIVLKESTALIQEQIKSYWPLNKNETSFLFSLLVVSAILFWAIRFLRLNDPVAVQVKSNISIYIDKKNAKEFVEESKLTLDALVEMFEVKVNEDLRSDVKKFIKANVDELNTLADKDEWDLMYAKLYNEFNVEANSTKGKDLLKTFQFVF